MITIFRQWQTSLFEIIVDRISSQRYTIAIQMPVSDCMDNTYFNDLTENEYFQLLEETMVKMNENVKNLDQKYKDADWSQLYLDQSQLTDQQITKRADMAQDIVYGQYKISSLVIDILQSIGRKYRHFFEQYSLEELLCQKNKQLNDLTILLKRVQGYLMKLYKQIHLFKRLCEEQ